MGFFPNGIPAISPDGRHVAFVVSKGNGRQLWVRDLDSVVGRLIPGTDGAYGPFWSPDSRLLAFFATGKLRRVDPAGGPAIALCDVGNARGGSWGKDLAIIFTPNLTGPLFRITATGGRAEAITSLDTAAKEASHRFPWFLPDGRHFVYTVATEGLEKATIYFADIEQRGGRAVVEARSNAIYADPGYLLFVRDQVLIAQPMNPDKGVFTGEPMPVAAPVDYFSVQVQGEFAASQNGTLVYQPTGGGSTQLTWFRRDGTQAGILGAPAEIRSPAISPDGSMVAVDRDDPQINYRDIWLQDSASGQMTRFTFNGRSNDTPVWSPDGRELAYRSSTGGGASIYRKTLDGLSPELVADLGGGVGGRYSYPQDWTSDGRSIVEMSSGPSTLWEIWLAPLVSSAKAYPLLQGPSDLREPRISPDGNWIAYESNETRRYEIYVQAFPAGTGRRQVSVDGGTRARWSRDGRELYFIGADGDLMAAGLVRKGSSLESGVPKMLFAARLTGASGYDVAKDGRFLIPVATEQTGPPMMVVLNWQAGLKK